MQNLWYIQEKIIMSILFIQMLSNLRFLVIGFVYWVTLGDLKHTPMNNRDFGLFPLKCKLEGAFSYMLIILNMFWNYWWSYDLYLWVKKPMKYTEHFYSFYAKITFTGGFLCGVASFFLNNLKRKDKYEAICIMNSDLYYILFVTVPLGFSILFNLFVNIKYGRDAWFKKFPKNYDRFRHIFIVQRVYFITWTLSMVPVILYSLVSSEIYMPLHTWVMAIQPSCIILWVIISNILKKNLSSQQMLKEGFVQHLKESSHDETDSK